MRNSKNFVKTIFKCWSPMSFGMIFFQKAWFYRPSKMLSPQFGEKIKRRMVAIKWLNYPSSHVLVVFFFFSFSRVWYTASVCVFCLFWLVVWFFLRCFDLLLSLPFFFFLTRHDSSFLINLGDCLKKKKKFGHHFLIRAYDMSTFIQTLFSILSFFFSTKQKSFLSLHLSTPNQTLLYLFYQPI